MTGKTSLLHNLNLGKITESYEDTIGTSLECIAGKRVQAVAWNMFGSRCPGSIVIRYRNIDAVIYMVNDTGHAENHLKVAKIWLNYLHSSCKIPILAVAVNRRSTGDEHPMTIEEVYTKLDLDEFSNTVKVFPVVATSGEGLDQMQDWLSQELGKRFTYQSFFGNDVKAEVKESNGKPIHTKVYNTFKQLFSRV